MTSKRVGSGGVAEVGAGSCGGGDVETRPCVVIVSGVDGWPSDKLLSSYCGSRPDFERMDEGYIGLTVRRERGGGGRRWRSTRRRHATHDDNQHNNQHNQTSSAFRIHFGVSSSVQSSFSQSSGFNAARESQAGRGARRTPRQARPRARKASDFHTPRLSARLPASESNKEKFK